MRYYRVHITKQTEGEIYCYIFIKQQLLSDRMFYKLYGLTKEEIRIVEEETK